MTGRYNLLNEAKSYCRKNAFLQKREIFLSHRKNFLLGSITLYCHEQIISTGIIILPHEDLSLPQKEISFNKKNFRVRSRNQREREKLLYRNSIRQKKHVLLIKIYFVGRNLLYRTKMPQRRDNAGAVCNSGMSMLFLCIYDK